MLKNLGVWVGIVILLFGTVMFVMSTSLSYYGQYGPGPGLFPSWLSGVLIILSILFIVDSAKKQQLRFRAVMPERKVMKRLAATVGAIALFIVIAPYVGFTLASIVVLLILLLPSFSWLWSIGIAVAVTLVLFVIFDVMLNIPLPTNALGW